MILMVFDMSPESKGYVQVQNIIQRAQALILNVKMLGADVTMARDLLGNAKTALAKEEYDSALQFAMSSLKEVMRLKKEHEEGRLSQPLSQRTVPPPQETGVATAAAIPANDIPMAKPITADAAKGAGPVPEGTDEITVSEDGKILGHEFITGLSYLIEEGRADKCFIIFQRLEEQEFQGLIITRTNPRIIKKRYKLDNSEMLWLTDRESTTEPTISPSLENMIYVAEEYIDGHDKPLLLLDGLEYLISNNTFNSVLRFIRRLIDKISESEAILLIGASQGALQDQELKLLEKETAPILI
jgi:hypothetical protein